MSETSNTTRRLRKAPRTDVLISVRASERTRRQWLECRAIAKLLGMDGDQIMSRALNHAKLDLQRRVRKQTPSIDWASVYAAARRKRGETAPNPVNYMPRTPRVDS